jgi:hypothetical protein
VNLSLTNTGLKTTKNRNKPGENRGNLKNKALE